jgi:hypothetical protein
VQNVGTGGHLLATADFNRDGTRVISWRPGDSDAAIRNAIDQLTGEGSAQLP